MPVEEPDPQGPAALAIAAILAVLAHMARMLRRGWPGLMRLFAGALGAGVAGFSFGAFIIGVAPSEVPSELVWAAGGAVGWVGGDLLETLARTVMRRFGVEERKSEKEE